MKAISLISRHFLSVLIGFLCVVSIINGFFHRNPSAEDGLLLRAAAAGSCAAQGQEPPSVSCSLNMQAVSALRSEDGQETAGSGKQGLLVQKKDTARQQTPAAEESGLRAFVYRNRTTVVAVLTVVGIALTVADTVYVKKNRRDD